MITANNLLYKALDYDGFWNSSKRFRDSEPSKARKLQLESLLTAFQISKKNGKSISQIPNHPNAKSIITETYYSTSKNSKSLNRLDYIKTLSDFQYLVYGEFLADIDRGKYKETLSHITSTAKKIFPDKAKNIKHDSINLVRLFRSLYTTRHIAFNTFESSFLKWPRQEYLVEEEYGEYFKQKFVRNIPSNFTEIDEILCKLIDPERRSFTEAEINYPEYDLEKIDLAWQISFRR